MQTFLLLVVAAGLAIVGDYFIKLASSQSNGLSSPKFVLGAILYDLPAFAWFFLMRSHSLAAVGVLYSAATLILLTLMGAMVFRETIGLRDILGVTLALASVAVMTYRP